jgi:hypothetical protein
VRLFRRPEPLHVRLAREGGLAFGNEGARAPWDAAGIHGLHRPREWDAVVTVEVPELEGERAAFVTLGDGTLVVEEGADGLGPLAEAVESELQAPYRAEAVRRGQGLWAVAARAIELVELPGIEGEELELVLRGAERTLLVDGERSFFHSLPQLERAEHVVRARHVDGETWEVSWDPL